MISQRISAGRRCCRMALGFTLAFCAGMTAIQAEAAQADRDPYGGWTAIKGKKTGFFHTEEISGHWWFVTPDGNAFFSKGANSVSLDGTVEEKTTRPGTEGFNRWAETTAGQLRSWGVNTAGCWSSPELGAHDIAYCVRPHLSATKQGELPDVFDPKWLEQAKARASSECAKYRSDPWLLGYFTDNELEWEHEDKAKEVLKHFLAMPAGSPGRLKAEACEKKGGKEGADAFRQQVAAAYFRGTSEAIHAADPNHLILGCRFAGHPPISVVRAMKGHVDVISINNYSGKPPVDLLNEMHKATGLPVMVTEWSVKGKDSGPLTAHGSGPVEATQRDRAAHYRKYVEEVADLNYAVGFHWFRYRDHPGSNQGLVKTSEQPWTELVGAMKELNPKLDQRHQH